jgi:hypothetical protein
MSDALWIAIITGLFGVIGKVIDVFVQRSQGGSQSKKGPQSNVFDPTTHGGILNPSTVISLMVGVGLALGLVYAMNGFKLGSAPPTAEASAILISVRTETAPATATTAPSVTPSDTPLPAQPGEAATAAVTAPPTDPPTATFTATPPPLTAQVTSNAAYFSQPALRGLLGSVARGQTVIVLGHYPDHVLYPSSVCVQVGTSAGWMASGLLSTSVPIPDLPSTECAAK